MRAFRLASGIGILAFVVAGLVFLFLPPDVHIPSGTLPVAPLLNPTPGAPVDADSLAADIVVANVFSPARTPPLRRVMPPELAGDSVNGMLADSAESSSGGAPPSGGAAVPALYGTMVGPDGARALLLLDPAVGGPRLYGPGDRAGSYRVIAVAAREVTLAGPSGRIVLRLPPKEERP